MLSATRGCAGVAVLPRFSCHAGRVVLVDWSIRPQVEAFEPYLVDLRRTLGESLVEPLTPASRERLAAALDGQAREEIHRLVPSEQVRSAGAFFTGSSLARRALAGAASTLSEDSVILDPACGVGDLLIECARHLPVATGFERTLRLWGSRIIGYDLHDEFVRAAKIRLVMTLVARGIRPRSPVLPCITDLFPHLRTGCGMRDDGAIAKASHIVMNPPYTAMHAPPGCKWASGSVNSAAVFVETCLRQAKSGARVVAILPDVLRCGTRYQKWRDIVQARTWINSVRVYGRFDRWADVDVFLLDLIVRSTGRSTYRTSWSIPSGTHSATVGDYFDVCVGPVVDYRDPHRGPWREFAFSRGLPAWKVLRSLPGRRRFAGRTILPPFVAVRRTSRPGDKHRAIATVIAGTRPVAVENHLLVLVPKKRTLGFCLRLVRVLQRHETTSWLDRSIRCRHLTVSALGRLPWWSDEL